MFKTWIVGLGEKVIMTFLEAYAAVMVAGNAFGELGAWKAAGVAALPAALTIVINGVNTFPLTPNSFLEDLVGRTLRTYVAGFLGFFVAAPAFGYSMNTLQAAALAGIPAAIAVAKGLISSRIGYSETAAALPTGLDNSL